MSLTSLLVLLIIAGVCGSVGRAIAGYSHGGCLVSIALGFIGAIVGVWLADALHFPHLFFVRVGGESFPIIWSIIGSGPFAAGSHLFPPSGLPRLRRLKSAPR